MPKQPGDKQIAIRIRYILEVIEQRGRLSISEIITSVAATMDIDLPNKNFRRTIERDIDNLANEPAPRIGVLYFKANGEEIPFEEREQHKNIRKECYLNDGKHHIYGGHLLKEHLILFYPQQGSVPQWSVSDFSQNIRNKRILFIFNTHKSYIALHVSVEDMPFKLIVARKVGKKLIPGVLEQVRKYHPKASLLLLPDSAISRVIPGVRLGHAMFEFDSRPAQGHNLGPSVKELEWKRNRITVRDFGSANGTYYQATELRENFEKNELRKKNGFDEDKTSFLPKISFEDEAMRNYEIPIGELEIMTEWVKVEFDLDKYLFDQEINKLEKVGLINKYGHPLNEDGSERTETILPNISLDEIDDKEKVDQVIDTLPISVKMGSTTFYVLHLP